MRFSLSVSSLCLAAAGLLMAMSGAMACGSGKLLFEEKFASLDPAWGFSENDESRTNGPDGLTYKLKPNDSRFLLSQASLYDDYEVCATFTTEAPERRHLRCGRRLGCRFEERLRGRRSAYERQLLGLPLPE